MEKTLELLRKFSRGCFYGAVTQKFEPGRIVLLKREETLKPADLSEKPRSHDAGQDE